MSAPHPHLDTIARVARAAGLAPADPLTQPLAEARANAHAYQMLWNQPLPEIGGTEEVELPSPHGGTARLRIHYPDQRRDDLGVLLYFHGGGFVLNSIDTHERLMRLLASRSGAAVVGLGYTLAPELRFPGQLDEALAAIAWVRRSGRERGLDPARMAVGGDSAGANLALAAMLALRDQGVPLPSLGLLFYGMFSADLATASHRAFGGGRFGLTTARVDWFWSQYVADRAQRDNPLAAPLLADLSGLPPQFVIGAGLDCLLDDSLALADKLSRAGVANTLSVYPGVPHSFMQMSAHLPPASTAIGEAATALRRALTPSLPLAAE
ncbi:MAG: alpha/beta hydrolase [Magnetospirillum sp.]|nr:alpha/beta hydrolase [Magnetospirillum sp.]